VILAGWHMLTEKSGNVYRVKYSDGVEEGREVIAV
jgi:hypothetical protein